MSAHAADRDDPEPAWARLSALLDEALDLERVDERAVWLRALGEREPETARELGQLLAAAAAAGSPVDDPAGGGRYVQLVEEGEDGAAAEPASRAGAEIGGWRLIERIGRGGMGEVYLGERTGTDFRQRAAVKLLAPEAQHPELRSRFARERRILAALAHDGIARFLDGGIAADGTPYLALEYVDGEALLAWCRSRRAPVALRLRVFVDVCDAVEHAHFNLVVHRDLKPSNVLVDRDGKVKLLDFGIAKIVEPESDSEAPAVERTELRAMTPRYAAPEQLAGGLVTPATDVYALGLLLFELLAGRPPVPPVGSDPFAAARALAERGAPRLAACAEVDASRPEGSRLRRALPSDLDRIVARATAPAPQQRYRSAGALGDDLRRFLAGRSVAARGDDRLDRARKFLRRHRAGAAAGVAILLAVAAGVLATVHQARLAERAAALATTEAARSAAAFDFLLKLFARSDPAESKGKVYTDDELLDLAAAEIDRTFAGQPELQVPIYEHLAAIRLQRSQYTQGLDLAQRALGLRRRFDGPAAVATAKTRRLVGSLLALLDRPAEARGFYRAAVAALEPVGGVGGSATTDFVEALSGLARVEVELGDSGAAERTASRALRRADAIFGPESDESFKTALALAAILSRSGRSSEALPYSERAAALGRQLYGIEAPDTLVAYGNLAILASNLGENDRLREILDEIQPIELRVFGPRRTDTLALARLRANLEEREGRFAAAYGAIDGAVATLRDAGPDAGNALGWALHHAGTLRVAAGEFRAGERLAREAVEFMRTATGTDEPAMLAGLAAALIGEGRHGEAQAALAKADRIQRERGEVAGAWRAETLLQRGRIAGRQGERGRAREDLEAAVELSSRAAAGGNRSTARALVALLEVLDEPERGRRCVELLDRAVAIGRRFSRPDIPSAGSWSGRAPAVPRRASRSCLRSLAAQLRSGHGRRPARQVAGLETVQELVPEGPFDDERQTQWRLEPGVDHRLPDSDDRLQGVAGGGLAVDGHRRRPRAGEGDVAVDLPVQPVGAGCQGGDDGRHRHHHRPGGVGRLRLEAAVDVRERRARQAIRRRVAEDERCCPPDPASRPRSAG